MHDFLTRILAATRERLAARQLATPDETLRLQATQQPPPLDFARALRPSDGGICAIAEFKRASPSKGVLNPDAQPDVCARHYAAGGAAAVSVLTEEDFFRGSLADLRSVKQTLAAAGLPVLRKDFIVDPYQVIEARAAGADAFLLIVALLDDDTLAALIAVGRQLGMEPLVEVHTDDEARRAVAAGARIVGVNARDLHTFAVDITLIERIRPSIPADVIVVAESGIATMADVARLRGHGAQAILVGETLMRAAQPQLALRSLIALPPLLRQLAPRPVPIVKLCGMRTPADALAAYAAGADLIGMVFAPSKRQVTIAQARSIVRALPDDAVTVGIFLGEAAPEQQQQIEAVVAATGIRAVQLCGRGAAGAAFAGMTVPLLRSCYLADQAVSTAVASAAADCQPRPDETILLEHALPVLESSATATAGGSGVVGNWAAARKLMHDFPMLLAGGLQPGNVAAAIRQTRPWGVDVSSGIEDSDGLKDPALMHSFVQAARSTASLATQSEIEV